jgi:hypothetical protein
MRRKYQLALGALVVLLVVAWALSRRHWRGTDERATDTPEAVHGQVVDSGGPLVGARVRFKADNHLALTDSTGHFHLPESAHNRRRVTAAKDGYLIAGADTDSSPLTLTLMPLPKVDHEAYAWVDPVPDPAGQHNCGNCHREIYREWSGSAHGRSATNRRFLNLYDGSDWHGRKPIGWNLLADNPAGAGVCNACHAPTADFDTDLRKVQGVHARGVHCDFCHKVAEASTDGLGLTHGKFGLKLLRPEQGQLFLGPLDDVDRGEDSYAPLYRDSRYCASCHEGVVFGVHVYSTYSEWLDSPARRDGKQCQSCHMKPTGDLANIAPGKGGVARDPATLASHQFPGGELSMVRRCFRVTVRWQRDAAGIRTEVEVLVKDVGHRVPTGFVDRNVVLVVEGLDSTDRVVSLRSGPRLPKSAGPLAGAPGKLYAKELKDFDGVSPVPFWRADPDVRDTRLYPEQPDRSVFLFPHTMERIRLRLLYRRFWLQVVRDKGWPSDEIVVVDRTMAIPPTEQTTEWTGP